MKTNKVYIAKSYNCGLCFCGKHGCGLSASMNKIQRDVEIHNIGFADVIRFTCQKGHRNTILI